MVIIENIIFTQNILNQPKYKSDDISELCWVQSIVDGNKKKNKLRSVQVKLKRNGKNNCFSC